MINTVTLVGRLTKDPELRHTINNVAYLRFTVASNRSYTNQNGDREADFINCVAWRAQAENMARFLKKGALIGVTGSIQTDSYRTQDGQTRYTTEVSTNSVLFLEPKNSSNNNNYQNNNSIATFQKSQPEKFNQFSKTTSNDYEFNNTIDISDDDLPF